MLELQQLLFGWLVWIVFRLCWLLSLLRFHFFPYDDNVSYRHSSRCQHRWRRQMELLPNDRIVIYNWSSCPGLQAIARLFFLKGFAVFFDFLDHVHDLVVGGVRLDGSA